MVTEIGEVNQHCTISCISSCHEKVVQISTNQINCISPVGRTSCSIAKISADESSTKSIPETCLLY